MGPDERWDEVVFRGDRDAGEWTAFYLHEGRMVAALTVGRSEDLIHARRLIEERSLVDDLNAALADSDKDLSTIGQGRPK